jgi:ubiquinone/menaquinone biosynthesis C-methylase UbiE
MTVADAQQRRFWDQHAATYDRGMRFAERRILRDTRDWVCRRATGRILEVAIGTGLNICWYDTAAQLTGLDLSWQMLQQARRRAGNPGPDADMVEGSAEQLPFADDTFDTVLCTLSLCSVPDDRQAVREMIRVLKPGQKLILADHVESSVVPARLLQQALDWWTVPHQGEHFRRRPIRLVQQAGLPIIEHERFLLGIIERLVATKPRR